MSQGQESFHQQRILSLINRHASPLAVLLVLMALLFSQPKPVVLYSSLVFLALGVFFNLWFFYAFRDAEKRLKAWMAQFRLFVNLSINTLLVLLLGGHWPPMWLLLALSAIATAVYATRAKTLVMAGTVSAILLAVHSGRSGGSPVEWGEQAVYSAFIILISLMINDLARIVLPEKSR